MTRSDDDALALYLRQFRAGFEQAAGKRLPEGFEDAEVEAYRKRGVPAAEAARDFLETSCRAAGCCPEERSPDSLSGDCHQTPPHLSGRAFLIPSKRVRCPVIALPRSLARRFRAVLRRCGPKGRRADLPPSVILRAGEQGLRLEAACPDVAVRLEHPGRQPEAVLAFPADALALFEGRTDEPVSLEQKSFGQGVATWDEGGSPVCKDFPTLAVEGLPPFPEAPARLRKLDAAFLRALDDACGATARDSGRYALERVLLRGKDGQVVATDARHLLVQSGFDLPWSGDALVPRLGVWGMKELPQDSPVGVGRTEGHVFVRAGPWTIALGCDSSTRFPAYDQIIPRASSRTGVLSLSRFRFAPVMGGS